eukprot:CAMPEP_0184081370 /NCGR_PEP_ID=MMETSP0974-20121125/2670_1 /TAXON_ID=483370 /ORGANISM="non described non described, Strain CCMP2097" /LENGTH=709 /DNA_ID=CAMNT_0026384041 /DNA_START=78 /DNA_END=2205 /DNA_ORIENTATION=-
MAGRSKEWVAAEIARLKQRVEAAQGVAGRRETSLPPPRQAETPRSPETYPHDDDAGGRRRWPASPQPHHPPHEPTYAEPPEAPRRRPEDPLPPRPPDNDGDAPARLTADEAAADARLRRLMSRALRGPELVEQTQYAQESATLALTNVPEDDGYGEEYGDEYGDDGGETIVDDAPRAVGRWQAPVFDDDAAALRRDAEEEQSSAILRLWDEVGALRAVSAALKAEAFRAQVLGRDAVRRVRDDSDANARDHQTAASAAFAACRAEASTFEDRWFEARGDADRALLSADAAFDELAAARLEAAAAAPSEASKDAAQMADAARLRDEVEELRETTAALKAAVSRAKKENRVEVLASRDAAESVRRDETAANAAAFSACRAAAARTEARALDQRDEADRASAAAFGALRAEHRKREHDLLNDHRRAAADSAIQLQSLDDHLRAAADDRCAADARLQKALADEGLTADKLEAADAALAAQRELQERRQPDKAQTEATASFTSRGQDLELEALRVEVSILRVAVSTARRDCAEARDLGAAELAVALAERDVAHLDAVNLLTARHDDERNAATEKWEAREGAVLQQRSEAMASRDEAIDALTLFKAEDVTAKRCTAEAFEKLELEVDEGLRGRSAANADRDATDADRDAALCAVFAALRSDHRSEVTGAAARGSTRLDDGLSRPWARGAPPRSPDDENDDMSDEELLLSHHTVEL